MTQLAGSILFIIACVVLYGIFAWKQYREKIPESEALLEYLPSPKEEEVTTEELAGRMATHFGYKPEAFFLQHDLDDLLGKGLVTKRPARLMEKEGPAYRLKLAVTS